jgi:hypothetical protein
VVVWVTHLHGCLLAVWCVFMSLLSVVNDAYHAVLITYSICVCGSCVTFFRTSQRKMVRGKVWHRMKVKADTVKVVPDTE